VANGFAPAVAYLHTSIAANVSADKDSASVEGASRSWLFK
jgi:hypothetical protein